MIHEAQCNLRVNPGVAAKPTKVLDASSHIDWNASIPVTQEQLGGKSVRLVVKGEHVALLMKIIAALKQPGADVDPLLKVLKELHERSDTDTDTRADGDSAA